MSDIKFRLTLKGKIVGYEWHKPLTIGDGHIEVFHSINGDEWHNIQAAKYYFIEHDSKDYYTGLKDKNGVEIYEGDILTHPDYYRPHAVQWCMSTGNYDAGWVGFNVEPEYDYDKEETITTLNHLEVIGNIYENAELLK